MKTIDEILNENGCGLWDKTITVERAREVMQIVALHVIDEIVDEINYYTIEGGQSTTVNKAHIEELKNKIIEQ